MSKIQQTQVFVDTAGAQHETIEAAEAAQFALDNAEIIETISESYVNIAVAPGAKVSGLAGRTRAFNKNVAASVIAFILSNGGMLPEDFATIEPSEELQKRLDEEAAKVAEARAKAEAKKADKEDVKAEDKVDVTADADADLFKED